MRFLPTVVNIETVNRFCDARCPMCTIKFLPDFKNTASDDQSYRGIARKAEIMKQETFNKIISKFKNHVNNITALNLHGCGEPLLDKNLPSKIAYAKKIGFTNIGFSTNCNILTKDKTKQLLESGLNCLLASIDGFSKEVQEEIRPGTNFERIYKNVKYFIDYRNKNNFPCRILPRMVRQQANKKQWIEYENYWNSLLDPNKGDKVLFMDIHNTGGKVKDFEKQKVNDYDEKISSYNFNHRSELDNSYLEKIINTDPNNKNNYIKINDAEKAKLCPDPFARINIFASGDVALCSADQAEYFNIGNIIKQEVDEVYNSEVLNKYRKKWLNNKHLDLKYCDKCTIAVSRFNKSYQSV